MAAAFGVPVVVLFGPSDPLVWAPWRVEHQLLCSPEGIEAISTKQVISALDALRVQR
jgi:heptosyltransferase-3